jgi:hypothetical protein
MKSVNQQRFMPRLVDPAHRKFKAELLSVQDVKSGI